MAEIPRIDATEREVRENAITMTPEQLGSCAMYLVDQIESGKLVERQRRVAHLVLGRIDFEQKARAGAWPQEESPALVGAGLDMRAMPIAA